MSSSSRCLIAAVVLALSALLLSHGASPVALGTHAVPALIVVLIHAWVIAVAERTCPDRGGKDIKRFPLGPRLLEGGSVLTVQLAVPVLLLTLGTRSLTVGLGGLVVIAVLSTAALRKLLPFLLPIGGAIWAVSTMNEFHTISDLLDSARGGVSALMGLVLGTFVLSGPLLRTDMAGVRTPRGKLVVIMTGLPAVMAGVLIASRPDLIGAPPDLLALAGGILMGGLLQSALASLLAKAGDIEERAPEQFPFVSPRSVGLALMVFGLPAMAPLAFGWLGMPSAWVALGSATEWAGLSALLMVIPLVPAAVLVAEALDRADGRRGFKALRLGCWAALGAWFVAGPLALGWVHGPGGLVAGLMSVFPGVPAPWPLVVGHGARSAFSGTALGGDLMFGSMPVADLARGMTLLVAATAALSARSMRHASELGKGVRWGTLVLAGALSLGGLLALLPRIGPAGAPLGVAAGCLVMLMLDACREPTRRVIEEPGLPSGEGEGATPGEDLLAPTASAEAAAETISAA